MEPERVATTADRLAEALKDTDKKQIDLARETGLNAAAINRYLKGRYDPKWDAIMKLALALNVSEMWLWGYNVPKERSDEDKKTDKLAHISSKLRRNESFFQLVNQLSQLESDKLVHIISKLGKNESFYQLVDELSQLETEHYDSIHQLLTVFLHKK